MWLIWAKNFSQSWLTHLVSRDFRETPDSMRCLLDSPDKEFQVSFESTFSNTRNRAIMEFIGTEAILDRNRGRDEIPPENKRGKHQKNFDETT